MGVSLIAPNKGLASLARQVASELGRDVRVVQGLLDEAVAVARAEVARGAEVLVSRGGTATRIRAADLGVPVVEVSVTAHDVLQAVKNARGLGSDIILVGFATIATAAEGFAQVFTELTGIRLRVVRVDDEASFLEEMVIAARAAAAGPVFVGGHRVIELAGRIGAPAVLLESSHEGVRQALLEALRVRDAIRAEKRRANELKAILDFIWDGVVAVDRDNRVTLFNPVAESIMGIPTREVIGQDVRRVIPDTRLPEVVASGRPQLGELQEVGRGVTIVTNRVPILVDGQIMGAVATFQEVNKLQKLEQNVRIRLTQGQRGLVAKHALEDVLGVSANFRATVEAARKFSQSDACVLITGESGTGKEILAQGIHLASKRAAGPFVAVNCGALPENLLESELFGYVEGSFTGARKGGKPGLFELAHGGTIFLDEVSEVSPSLQSRFLRVIQEKEVMRLGDTRVVPVDVRVIAATNRPLEDLVERGEFRRDLYYRLNVLRIKVPPLRERPEDVPLLLEHFLRRKAEMVGARPKRLRPDAVSLLMTYRWPGNIRQLENLAERLCLLVDSELVGVEDLARAADDELQRQVSPSLSSRGLLAQTEELAIMQVLREVGWNRAKAAERLGISTTTLWRRLKRLQLHPETRECP
ncbi:MAG: sigma 54-interacting transcriptional regulator [Bacillota bacterium]|nr:sigma 54-interacting transcriptional regulator [Bacillota bacterium]